jgi:hypothetical protein
VKDAQRARLAARDTGLRRARAMTTWTAVGATAAATVLSVVLAEGSSSANASTVPQKTAPAAPTTTQQPTGSTGSSSPAQAPQTQAPQTQEQLQPPTQAPQAYSGGQSSHGGSGGT